jgi:protein-tyrosine phosphatase
MVDIHSHILPGLDDGPESLDESLAMVRMAAAAGTTDIVATPHANSNFAFDAETRDAKIRELQEVSGELPRIHSGCDFHLSYENIQQAMAYPTRYTINYRNYLLVEFADVLIPKSTAEMFSRMLAVGIIPVITHPERNPLLQRQFDELEQWLRAGARIQVTGQSLLGRFGRVARNSAEEMLERGMVQFLASDGHDCEWRPPVLAEAYGYIAKNFAESLAEKLCVENPRATLTGENVPLRLTERSGRNKKWFQFWA